MFNTKMDVEATPDRVFALAQLIDSGKGAYTRDDLREMMEPKELEGNSSRFSNFFRVLKELGIAEESDAAYSISEAFKGHVGNFDDFRRKINSKLSEYSDGPFYLLTKVYLQKFPEIIKDMKGSIRLTNNDVRLALDEAYQQEQKLQGITPAPLDATQIRAWRFWGSALGFGYGIDKEGTIFLADPAEYFLDLLKIKGVTSGMELSVSQLIEKLSPDIDLLMTAEQRANRQIPYVFSKAISALPEDVFRKTNILDTESWTLNLDEGETEQVSHITVGDLERGAG
ncbi:hypothetical protein [Faecalibaculum rodentium]|uniref:hypothetical protein n=2 Tax=Faecalibaculum rodentium TaxID=1702221 RepID=UPI002670BBB5|nr:hypothetical protein [Faecalibaculum rodentium]